MPDSSGVSPSHRFRTSIYSMVLLKQEQIKNMKHPPFIYFNPKATSHMHCNDLFVSDFEEDFNILSLSYSWHAIVTGCPFYKNSRKWTVIKLKQKGFLDNIWRTLGVLIIYIYMIAIFSLKDVSQYLHEGTFFSCHLYSFWYILQSARWIFVFLLAPYFLFEMQMAGWKIPYNRDLLYVPWK